MTLPFRIRQTMTTPSRPGKHYHVAVIDGKYVSEIERFQELGQAIADVTMYGKSYRKQWELEPVILTCTHGRCFHPTSRFKHNGKHLCQNILQFADRVQTPA